MLNNTYIWNLRCRNSHWDQTNTQIFRYSGSLLTAVVPTSNTIFPAIFWNGPFSDKKLTSRETTVKIDILWSLWLNLQFKYWVQINFQLEYCIQINFQLEYRILSSLLVFFFLGAPSPPPIPSWPLTFAWKYPNIMTTHFWLSFIRFQRIGI